MTAFRKTLIPIAAIYSINAIAFAIIGSFAEADEWWEYSRLVFIKPISAAALLALVCAPPESLIKWGLPLIMLALGVAVSVPLFTAITIAQGATEGSLWRPLASCLIPGMGLLYGAMLISARQNESD